MSPFAQSSRALVLVALLVPAAASAGDRTAVAESQEVPEEVLALGRTVFTELAEPQCAICHILSDAGAAGEVGPDLDALKPDRAMVVAAVTQGVGVMPAYGELLSEEQIAAVAAYVATVSGGAGP